MQMSLPMIDVDGTVYFRQRVGPKNSQEAMKLVNAGKGPQ